MINYITGNLFEDKSEALVNAVNCVGIMGRGIAKQFKYHYPHNFKQYAAACRRDEVVPGKMFLHNNLLFQIAGPKWIINFPTKYHWREMSRLSYIEQGLVDLVKVVDQHNIKTIALPALGCGLGGLDWLEVKPLIEQYLSTCGLVTVYTRGELKNV